MQSDSTDTATDRPSVDARIDAAEGTERAAWAALRTVEDPELPVSIVDLGLVYDLTVTDGRAEIDLTLTYSGCPARDLIVDDSRSAVRRVEGIDDAAVRLVYSPPWGFDRITPAGRAKLNEHGLAVPGDDGGPDPSCHD